MTQVVVCAECYSGVLNDSPCILCRGSGLLQKMIIKTGPNETWEVWAPSTLTQEQAQAEYDKSIDLLLNNFSLTD
jgi:hypothetical protein